MPPVPAVATGPSLLIINPLSSPANGNRNSAAPPPYNEDLPTGNRPQLPMRNRNRFLGQPPTASDPDALVVKFQTIVREDTEIVVGRLKIATNANNEHAFVLRRYDTGAISVTTMYKAAFPTASPEEEEREMRWIKSTFDLTGMNGGRGSTAVKLAGNWIPANLATHLAPAYKLGSWIHAMVEASPEAGVAYRKSQRSQAAAEEAANRGNGTPASPAGPGGAGRAAAPPASRDSIHTSRGPTSATNRPAPADNNPSSAETATKRQRTDNARPSTSSAQPAQENTVAVTVQTVTEITGPANIEINADAEIAENRAMVARLTAEYQARSAAGQSAEEMGLVESTGGAASGSVRGVKRTVNESLDPEVTQSGSSVTVTTDGSEAAGRLIAGNKRVRVVAPEVANRRNAVWGPAFLAVGGAVGWLAANYWL